MVKLKKFYGGRGENLFILGILLSTVILNFVVVEKMAFLNVFYLPIIVGGYYLGRRAAVVGAFLVVLILVLNFMYAPAGFKEAAPTTLDLYMRLVAWGSFLILSAYLVGTLKEQIAVEIQNIRGLNQALKKNETDLQAANLALQDHSATLEEKVRQRTHELSQSTQAVERLKAKVESALYSTMDSAVAKLIIEGRLRPEKRPVSVLFSDVCKFTSISEKMSPENVVRDLNHYLSEMEPILLEYRAHIDKYMGDGIMCEFGAPLDLQQYRLLAVRAALRMQSRWAQTGKEWKMRIGIASGEAIMGLVGSKRQFYTGIGDVVNIASRLEKLCEPGGILIDRYTCEGIERFMEVRAKKGISHGEGPTSIHEDEIEELQNILLRGAGSETAKIRFRLGRLHFENREFEEALTHFEQALREDIANDTYKLAFAEASMALKTSSKVEIRGRRNRIYVFEVLGVKDVLRDAKKVPRALFEAYGGVLEQLKIPAHLIDPIESIDGSVGHARMVALLSYAVATRLGLGETEKEDILNAAYFADIGKEIIPPHVLNRAGTLSETEYEIVKKHSTESPHILKCMGYDSASIERIIRHSHEAMDGSGYPEGLVGEAIPLGSRIISVADTFSAIVNWRRSREGLDPSAAFDELRRGAEKGKIDANVLKAFFEVMGGATEAVWRSKVG